MLKNLSFFVITLILPLGLGVVSAKEMQGRIPDEVESDGGHSLGFGIGGAAAVSGLSSVKNNPAMLAFEKKYQISAAYHWPSYGRRFYQAGVVDSKTSNISAGVLYTSFSDKYISQDKAEQRNKLQAHFDVPLKRRISLALAQSFSLFSAGLSAQLVSPALAFSGSSREIITLGFGFAALINSNVRFGLSVENLNNEGVKDLAPTVYRAGLAATFFSGRLTGHIDYRQRDRVAQETSNLIVELGNIKELKKTSGEAFGSEKMLTASFSVQFQNLFRLLGGYSRELRGSGRSSLSGGVALVNESVALSFLHSQPYLSESEAHQALNISFLMSI